MRTTPRLSCFLSLATCAVTMALAVPAGAEAPDIAKVPAAESAEAAVAVAEEAARTWLKQVDEGRYAESWDSAAGLFKAAMSRQDWEAALKATRTPLGAVKTRAVRSAEYATALPGVPDGHYVVVQFSTSFENKAVATETVTPTKDKDGTWRVSGYYIK